MDIVGPIDPLGGAVVVAGTALATLARVGLASCRTALRHVAALSRPGFDLPAVRAQLAQTVEQIRRDGVIRAQPIPLADAELWDASHALCRFRSVEAMLREHERHRALREAERAQAGEALVAAGELAPVMGLVGTLLSLGRMPGAELASEVDILGAVSMAVVSTLAGLLLAHLLFLPLAQAIERRGRREEHAREELVQWLARQLAPACPSTQQSRGEAA